jgi:hypothetical protein
MPIYNVPVRIGGTRTPIRVTAKATKGIRAAIAPLAIIALGGASPVAMKVKIEIVFDHPLPNTQGKRW